MKHWRGISLVVCLLALMVMLIALIRPGRFSPSARALQQYQAQLRRQGEKLTFAELGKVRPADADALIGALTNALGGLGGSTIQPGGLSIREYDGPGRARVSWQEEAPNWSTPRRHADLGVWEEFAAEAKRSETQLAAIREVLKNPAPDCGPRGGALARLNYNFGALRIAAQWLAAVTLSETRQGRLPEALENLEALAALARVNHDEDTLVAQMIRTSILGLGNAVCWEVLQAPGWTDPQLERLQQAWHGVDLMGGLETAFLGERALANEMWVSLRKYRQGPVFQDARGKPQRSFSRLVSDNVYLRAYRLTSIDQDQLFFLQTMQESLQAFRQVDKRPWKEVRKDLDKADARVAKFASTPQQFRYWFSTLTLPMYSKAASTVVRNECERRMTITAISLKRYELRYQRPAPNLGVLLPDFLSALPVDLMSTQPFCYRSQANGTALLYSVGEDGHDDGGNPSPAAGTTFGLWVGQDSVWPSPSPR